MRLKVRERTIISLTVLLATFIGIFIAGLVINESHYAVSLTQVFERPSWQHVFGTDAMGRDMLSRTLKGLSLSIQIGLICTLSSSFLAIILGVFAPMIGKKADAVVGWLVDLVLSVPHTLVVILIAVAVGGGVKGIWIGITLTHWTSLTRVIRAEVKQIQSMPFVKISRKMGKSNAYIAFHHVMPLILPQLFIGMVLIFPHAVLHEASITFLGFGLAPHEPAIGIILSESMKYLTSGKWWLAFFPGLSLVTLSLMIDGLASGIKKWLTPETAYL